MAFLDNSGDIILDAVLTDTGRMRLARGDGSFRIAKFAFGDDEINYALYDKNNSSGSAYYDLEILQTPILEAFTNNTSFLKSKLMTIPRTNLLYLPIMEVNQKPGGPGLLGTKNTVMNTWVVVADDTTKNSLLDSQGNPVGEGSQAATNLILGSQQDPTRGIVIDQGLETTEIPSDFVIDPDLAENQYIIEIDNRLGQIVSMEGQLASVSFIDDDNIASYYISQGAGGGANFITTENLLGSNNDAQSPIAGPRGTRLRFSIKSSVELQTSDYLFTKLGSTVTTGDLATAVKNNSPSFSTGLRFIDTTVRVTGGQTGYRLDIPLRFIKGY